MGLERQVGLAARARSREVQEEGFKQIPAAWPGTAQGGMGRAEAQSCCRPTPTLSRRDVNPAELKEA